jgi:hypothetical protein
MAKDLYPLREMLKLINLPCNESIRRSEGAGDKFFKLERSTTVYDSEERNSRIGSRCSRCSHALMQRSISEFQRLALGFT